jgi:hypothetical protein
VLITPRAYRSELNVGVMAVVAVSGRVPTLKLALSIVCPGARAGSWKKYKEVIAPGAWLPEPLKFVWKPDRDPLAKF